MTLTQGLENAVKRTAEDSGSLRSMFSWVFIFLAGTCCASAGAQTPPASSVSSRERFTAVAAPAGGVDDVTDVEAADDVMAGLVLDGSCASCDVTSDDHIYMYVQVAHHRHNNYRRLD